MGVSLNTLLGWVGQLTHRQHVLWMEFANSEMNNPSLTDHYLMSLACVVARGNSTKPKEIQPEDFRLKFTPVEVKSEQANKDDRMKDLRNRILTMVGSIGGAKIVDEYGRVLKDAPKKKVTSKRPSPKGRQSKPVDTEPVTPVEPSTLLSQRGSRRKRRGN